MEDIPIETMLTASLRLLEGHPLCDGCMGRQFAWLGTGTSNEERGRSLKLVLTMTADRLIRTDLKEKGKNIISILAGNGMFESAKKLAAKNGVDYKESAYCHLCTLDGQSVFKRIPEIVQYCVERLARIEYDSFLVGSIPAPVLSEREDELRSVHGLLHGENLKSHFNRELGKHLQEALRKPVEFESPDIVVVFDMTQNLVRFQVKPLFIYGRYRKLVRGIPQSRWDCTVCGGAGCDECKGTGRRYPDSISEYIGIPAREAARAVDFKFHAAGREDIDVLMLGSGRPFVLELKRPRIRNIDLESLAREIVSRSEGRIEVSGLSVTRREMGQALKRDASVTVKEYFALMRVDRAVTEEELRAVEKALQGVDIDQRTPTRVAHRRSDLVRRKRVHDISLKPRTDGLIEVRLRVQGGTYVKELISGDEQRTQPSIAGLLGAVAECVELNVVAVHTETSNTSMGAIP
ncbi:MAG: tRNA pseudouridine(54/55) synthase Pus10 [Candidatus Thorarchaeota archaeon]|nr:tRNA pseudouridine(54/55) synthase Pus10 [Candidatus Thorarchaeota archaeon]